MSISSVIFGIICLCLGMLIGRQARHDRDERINELEQKLKQYEDNQRF